MPKRKNKRNNKMPPAILHGIFAVVAMNAFAFHKLTEVANSWKGSILPGSISVQLIQLACILGLNCIVIIYLLIKSIPRR